MQSQSFIAKFQRLFDLSGVESDFLRTVQIRPVFYGANQNVVREGDRATRCVIILDGLAGTSKVNENGKRQTAAFHMAGDMPDLMSLHLDALDSDIRTLSNCTVAFVDHTVLRSLCDTHPRLSAALWRATLIDASIYREWVLNLGSRPALNRVAHLLCEVMRRMDAIGLAKAENVCAFDVTQSDLGDATGLSVVHVNRTLQLLRKRGLMAFENGTLSVLDWEGLSSLGGFHDGYLHLEQKRDLTH